VLDDILIEIVAAVVIAICSSIWYALKVRRRRGGSMLFTPPAGSDVDVQTFQVTSPAGTQVPPQLQGIVDQAMRAAADGRIDRDEEAAIRAAALAAGAQGVAFDSTTKWTTDVDVDGDLDFEEGVEHLGPPPPGPPPPGPAPTGPA
jgi:hypothetical protein